MMHAQYISRVRSAETVKRMHDDGMRVFVEVGPGSVLTGFVGDILRDVPHLALSADSRRGWGLDHLLGVLGQLFVNHVPLDLASLYATEAMPTSKPAVKRPLESAVPFIALDEPEVSRLREMLQPADAVTPAARLPVATDDAHDGLSGWSGHLPLPFPAKIEMVGLDAGAEDDVDPGRFAPHLGDEDLAYFAREIAPLGAWRRRDWLLGRMAARRAVAGWLAETGAPDHPLDIVYDPVGRPMLANGLADRVFLSVSHKDGIGAAAAADRPIGIDLERLTSVRDPQLVLDAAFSDTETALLAEAGWAETDFVAIAWSAKEAAAKALGRQLVGQEASFVITHVDPANETIRLAHAEGAIDAFYALDEDFVCVVATKS